MNSEIIVETVLSSENPEVKGKVEKKGGKRIGYNYIILKSLKEHPKNDVVKCIYIKSFTNFGICVIKEGTAGELKDKHDRDIKDRLIWQKELHQSLQGKVRIPRYIGSFEENGNYYLAIEYIKGKTLGQLCKEYGKDLLEGIISGNKLGIRFLGYLLKIIDLLDILHKNQIVHRDVTSANFMVTPRGKIALIDLELSYSLSKQIPTPPFTLGTYGYMSPEQLAVSTPTIKEDVFSVGAILLMIWSGITPVKLTPASLEELKDKVSFFIPDSQISNIVIQCLHPEAEERPLLSDVYRIIKQYRSNLTKKVNREKSICLPLSKEEIVSAIQTTIHTMSSSLLADKEKGWFAENHNADPKREKTRMPKAWYTSFHVGCAGPLYLLCQAHRIGLNTEICRPQIDQTLSLIEEKYINQINSFSPGLHLGSDGIAATLAEAIKCGLIENSNKHIDWINTLLSKKSALPGIMSGIAGQGIANLIASSVINQDEINLRLQTYVQSLLDSQQADGSWVRQSGKNSRAVKATRGYAYGIAGICHFLLTYETHYNNTHVRMSAEKGLHWLINNSIKEKNHIEWLSSAGKKISPWWADGGPGIALAFIKAYALSKNELYKKMATDALNFHPEKIFNHNLSQTNGLSGLGEIYLEAYKSLHDDQWLNRAEWIAQIILRLKKTHPKYGSYWLVEIEKQPLPGFMTGNAGVLHFLLRYCYPDKITLPMSPDPHIMQTIQRSHVTRTGQIC